LLTSRALTKEGSIIAVELSAAIVRSPSGHVRGIMAIGRDVTERRACEQAQHERIASLERRVGALAEGSASAGKSGTPPLGRGTVAAIANTFARHVRATNEVLYAPGSGITRATGLRRVGKWSWAMRSAGWLEARVAQKLEVRWINRILGHGWAPCGLGVEAARQRV
jgi:hypothetical protein